jgi:ABC-type branched-subunit amino acid transport system ATPase component
MSGDVVLEVEGIDFSYGPLQVLFDINVQVADGERVGLLGTNGAGKSTLLGVISGLLRPERGVVRLFGEDITTLEPHERVERGLMQIAGGKAIFPTLTVGENIRLGAYRHLKDKALVDSRVRDACAVFPHLASRLAQPAGTLSGGEQQMVALSRAMVSGAQLLLIDEVSLGLAPVVMGEVLRMIEELARRGVTMLLVEQSLNVSLALAQRAYFMERGTISFDGPTADLLERSELVRAVFFGRARRPVRS